jgi:enoyl-CoA hydratase
MRWGIELFQGVAIVRMSSSEVNKQNPEFFADLNEAFDRLDRDYSRSPIVLTGVGSMFSVGIDFEYSFALFQRRDKDALRAWFKQFRGAMLRVFRTLRPTVAAVNGHALGGGLILALSCDFRLAAAGDFRCGVNEVPVGIPMPSVYTELIRHRLGTPVSTEAILTGRTYSPEQARVAGIHQQVVEPEQLIPAAVQWARCVPTESMLAYEHSKRMLLTPVLERMHSLSESLDNETTADVIISEPLLQAQKQSLAHLRGRKRVRDS